jgi:Beta-galactosidase/beta-glucuronidase
MLFPKANASRNLIDLSGIWQFKFDDGNGFSEKWFQRKLVEPLNIAVPASYDDQIDTAGFRDHCGFVFYQTRFSIPKIMLGQRIVLRFEAVTHDAKVYLNGALICEHQGGFLPFEASINDYLDSAENLLTVAVSNVVDFGTLPVGNEKGSAFMGVADAGAEARPGRKNIPNFDFYNYCGITRPVKIYSTPNDYIEDIAITYEVIGNDAILHYSLTTRGEGKAEVDLVDEDDAVVGRATGAVGSIDVPAVKLWKPLQAYLYKLAIRFADDCYAQEVGFRTIEVRGSGFFINGQSFYFKGFGKHEDSSFHGRGLDEALNVKDLSLLKWIGANSFRCSHYPYSEEMLNLCDREGIVVIDETPAVGINLNWSTTEANRVDEYKVLRTHGAHEAAIREMIDRDKNHPCVVMWCIANEPDTALFPDSAYEYFRPLYEYAHALDPQGRPVTITGALQGKPQCDRTMPMMDVICLNRYYGWYLYGGDLEAAKRALREEIKYWVTKGKPILFTEFGTDTIAGLHQAVASMFSEEYQVEFLQAYFEVFDCFPEIIGEQIWNFADFQTSQGIVRVDGNKKGVFTRDRRPKMAAHHIRRRWQEK